MLSVFVEKDIFTSKFVSYSTELKVKNTKNVFKHFGCCCAAQKESSNLIPWQGICHVNHAVTKFQHVSTAQPEKSFGCLSVTDFCRCSDPCEHGSAETLVTSNDTLTYWVHWFLNLFINT